MQDDLVGHVLSIYISPMDMYTLQVNAIIFLELVIQKHDSALGASAASGIDPIQVQTCSCKLSLSHQVLMR